MGIINCAGGPTLTAPAKILKRLQTLAGCRLDVLNFPFRVTALCLFIEEYDSIIRGAYPDFELVLGTYPYRL